MHHKARGGPLMCNDCSTTAQKKESTLLDLLRAPDAWKCTCKQIPAGKRAYAALNQNMNHKGKCKLAPAAFGEQRWDGKNKGVTREDLQFLVARKSKW